MYRDLLAEQANTIVGIDLGTTNSLVAVATDARARVIASPEGERMLPSATALDEAGKIVLGTRALARRIQQPDQVITSIKRFMGRDVADAAAHAGEVSYQLAGDNSRLPMVRLGDKSYSAPEISALYLRELKRWAEVDLGKPVKKAVITVPAYFNEAQRQATRDAGRIAGLEVLRIVNEPTAAALAYGLEVKQEGFVAVYDFGGGTFDISILRISGGVFEVLATGGDTRLGGDDVDWMVANAIHATSPLDGSLDAASAELRQRFLVAAEQAKIALSSQPATNAVIDLPGEPEWECELTRDVLEAWSAPVVERTLDICREVLKASGIKAEQLEEVLLVGGSSRMPLVQREVATLFGRVPRFDINPEEVVALGAAVQARILAGGLRNMLLLDVTPLSLGLETWGGAFDVLIPRNTTVPATATQSFTTNVDGQTKIAMHVLQGEREMARDNRSLARFELAGLPPMRAGEPRIEVTFSLDANGMLSVSARELNTGASAAITVQPSAGLTDSEVESIIKDSYASAQQDFEERMLLERRNEAEALVRSVNLALKQSGAELETGYRAQVEAGRDALAAAIKAGDAAAMRECMKTLNETTEELARVQMDSVLAATVRGRTLDQIADEGLMPTRNPEHGTRT